MIQFNRIGRKTRRHVYVSREFNGVAAKLRPNYPNFSVWAERVLWEALIDEHGEQAVLEAIEDIQRDMDDEDVLPEDDQEHVELPA